MNTNEALEALQDLYNFIERSKRRKQKLSEKLIQEINDLEESIIRDEILPIIGQDIEPTLSQIKRDLVLVVEYHPGEPISVALSRKMKINQITDAKTITPVQEKVGEPVDSMRKPLPKEPHEPTKQVVNHTRGMRVQFPDGTVICQSTAIETFKLVLQKIGLQRVHDLHLQHAGYNIVSRKERTDGIAMWQHKVDGWYIYCNLNNTAKMRFLQTISEKLHLGLKINVAKK